jgi:peptide/nickel transport system permease protein
MTRYIIKRTVGSVLILVVVSIVTFGVFFLGPRDPAVLYAGRSSSAASIEATRVKLGLDKSIPTQYAEYFKGIFTGRTYRNGPDVTECPAPCLGYSFKDEIPVWNSIVERLPVTVVMALGAAILWVVVGTAVGVVSALRPGSFFDRASMITTLGGVALPVYFTGLILLQLFVYQWHVLPTIDTADPIGSPLKTFQSFILPWVALAFLYAALYARLTRANMRETLGEDYVRTARAKGLAERQVIAKHALRPVLTPIITIFGIDLGGLLGGAILTEYTFGLPGIGKLAIGSVTTQDLPMVLGTTIFAAFFIVAANLVVDVLYAYVDPRVRLD